MGHDQAKLIPVTECASLARKALRSAYPAVTFQVKSHKYSMGANLTVEWVDGPTSAQIEVIVAPFTGATYDSLTDGKGYKQSVLNGQAVRYQADSASCHRVYSAALLTKAAQKIALKYGVDAPRVATDAQGWSYIIQDGSTIIDNDNAGHMAWVAATQMSA